MIRLTCLCDHVPFRLVGTPQVFNSLAISETLIPSSWYLAWMYSIHFCSSSFSMKLLSSSTSHPYFSGLLYTSTRRPKSRTLGWCVRLFLLVEAEVKVDFRVAIWSAILHGVSLSNCSRTAWLQNYVNGLGFCITMG